MKKKDLVLDYIYDNIEKGIWKPDKRILGECDIAKRLGVSRNTVREALHELEKKDIIYKVNGSGSFIKKQNTKKILIVIDNQMVSYVKRSIFAKIADLIELSPFEMEIAYFNEYSNIDFSDIGGIINIAMDNYAFDFEKYHLEKAKNIPLINVLSYFISETPGVVFNLSSLYNGFFSLIKGHKNSIFFSFELKDMIKQINNQFLDDYYMNSYDICMQGIQTVVSSLYTHIKIPENYDTILENLDKAFSEIQKPPYAIVFCDDVLYTKAYPLFEKYDRIFGNTKIITHSNGFKMETGPYRGVKVELDLDDTAQASVKLITDLMNKKSGAKRNIIIDAKIKE